METAFKDARLHGICGWWAPLLFAQYRKAWKHWFQQITRWQVDHPAIRDDEPGHDDE
jgi:hypothetical protein